MTDFKLDTFYYLSTDGYKFKYRRDRYTSSTIHVELFKDGAIVHKQMAVSVDYNINWSHHAIINTLEARIAFNELDRTGLKQII